MRLSDDLSGCLREFCRQSGTDTSHAVNQALNAFLAPKVGATSAETLARLFPPEEILTTVCKYLAWGGDMNPRAELKRQFIEILACTFALKRVFPRDTSVQMLYQALRPLCPYFGMDTVRQSRGDR